MVIALADVTVNNPMGQIMWHCLYLKPKKWVDWKGCHFVKKGRHGRCWEVAMMTTHEDLYCH